MKSYVAQDPQGGWYGDCEGVMQDVDASRTQVEALQWCMDRLYGQLTQAQRRAELAEKVVEAARSINNSWHGFDERQKFEDWRTLNIALADYDVQPQERGQ